MAAIEDPPTPLIPVSCRSSLLPSKQPKTRNIATDRTFAGLGQLSVRLEAEGDERVCRVDRGEVQPVLGVILGQLCGSMLPLTAAQRYTWSGMLLPPCTVLKDEISLTLAMLACKTAAPRQSSIVCVNTVVHACSHMEYRDCTCLACPNSRCTQSSGFSCTQRLQQQGIVMACDWAYLADPM